MKLGRCPPRQRRTPAQGYLGSSVIETEPRDHVTVSRKPRFTSTTSSLGIDRLQDPLGCAPAGPCCCMSKIAGRRW